MATVSVQSHAGFLSLENATGWQSVGSGHLFESSSSSSSSSSFTIWHGIWTVFLLFATWAYTNLSLLHDFHVKTGKRRPPVLPYWIPGIGHTITFIFNRAGLLDTIKAHSKGKRAIRLSIIGQKINVITGADNIKAIWQNKLLDSRPAAIMMLQSMLQGRESNALRYWQEDDSGAGPKAHPLSKVASGSRIYHPTWKASHQFLTVKNSEASAKHIQTKFQDIMSAECGESGTTTIGDLRTFMQTHISTAVLDLMCGKSFLELNPEFVDSFWKFDAQFPSFMMGFTKWTAPAALKARDDCVSGIEKWHAFAAQNFDETSVNEDGFDPYWGSPLFRGRQDVWKNLESMDANAKACEDFGIIWAMNTNTVPAIFWAVVHCFKDPELLARVRAEAAKCRNDAQDVPPFDVRKLTESPLLQSICSEILRLYVAAFIPRGSTHNDVYVVDNYKISRGEFIAVDSYTAHRDKEVWNTGRVEDTYPLDSFWADRFIIDAEKQLDGPLRQPAGCPAGKSAVAEEGEKACPRYSMDGLSGSLIAFGGGKHQCPGRYFARREMMVCIAVLCSEYDFEFLSNDKVQMDFSFFGIGTLPSKGDVPVRIRRRDP